MQRCHHNNHSNQISNNMARPRKEALPPVDEQVEEQFEEAQGEINAPAPTPAPKPAKAVNPLRSTHKRYNRHVLEVEGIIGKKHGVKTLERFEGRFVEVAKKKGMTNEAIVMEPHRIARMNTKWHTTKFYYLEEGARIPDSIIRTPNDDTEVNGGWNDKFVY